MALTANTLMLCTVLPGRSWVRCVKAKLHIDGTDYAETEDSITSFCEDRPTEPLLWGSLLESGIADKSANGGTGAALEGHWRPLCHEARGVN